MKERNDCKHFSMCIVNAQSTRAWRRRMSAVGQRRGFCQTPKRDQNIAVAAREMLPKAAPCVAASGLALWLLVRWHRRYTARGVKLFLELLDSDAFDADCAAVYAYAAARHEDFERERMPSALPARIDVVVSGGGFKVCLAGGLAIARIETPKLPGTYSASFCLA